MSVHPYPRPQLTHLSEIVPRTPAMQRWERVRHRQAHWFVECGAEFIGVFLYTLTGVGSTAAFVLGNLAGESLASLLQVGFAYAMGIVLALVICTSTSGGHFHPGVTITFVLLKKFPPLKALRYIIAQILGAYVACMFVYIQYHHLISETELALKARGVYDAVMFTPSGPAGIFALQVAEGSNLGQVFINEMVCDFVIGLTVFSVLDPTNFFAPPAAGPWLIAFVYAVVIWSFSPIGLAANPARDVGGRLMALSIWGLKAGGGRYAAIAALTNVPVTVFTGIFYEFMFADSARVVTPGHVDFITAHHQHAERHEEIVTGGARTESSASLDEKARVEAMQERA